MGRINYTVLGGAARARKSEDRGNAWLTPREFVELVRAAMGGIIHLDPATEVGNPTGAFTFYTALDDGLYLPWWGNVFLNPPYSPLGPWVEKAIESAKAGARIYMLVPVRTDAAYHQRLLAASTDVLLLRGRLSFARPDVEERPKPAAFGSMLVGLGGASTQPLNHLGVRLRACGVPKDGT
jgi:hypothetical protein